MLILLLVAGCSGNSRRDTTLPTDAPDTRAVVEVHGVLHVPPPGATGVQGRTSSWLVADDGTAYDLLLKGGFEPLADPASSGRGVTISGEIELVSPVPVGAEPRAVQVTGFVFDP